MVVERASVHLCIHTFKHVYLGALAIAIKLYQKYHCGEGLPALDFEVEQIRTLVAIATDNSHRLCMEKTLSMHYLRYFQLDLFQTTFIRLCALIDVRILF